MFSENNLLSQKYFLCNYRTGAIKLIRFFLLCRWRFFLLGIFLVSLKVWALFLGVFPLWNQRVVVHAGVVINEKEVSLCPVQFISHCDYFGFGNNEISPISNITVCFTMFSRSLIYRQILHFFMDFLMDLCSFMLADFPTVLLILLPRTILVISHVVPLIISPGKT